MIKIAIVENETEQAELLRCYVERYSAEKGINCQAFVYENGLDFLSQYRTGPDGIFMDILMPLPDGMKATERLRRVDESVCLIFVTNMAQLAIRGYKVGATDFLVKPVSYFDFSMEMDKIVRAHERRANDSIWVSTAGSMRRVAFSDICYIEILMHDVVILTEKSLLCERHKIRFTYMIDGEQLDFMDPVDIASLFGNAVDNAIESVLRTDDAERRIIRLNAGVKRSFFSVHFENYCGETVVFRDGMPQTVKQDNRYHGFGVKSIRYIVEKYGGTLRMGQQGYLFNPDILLPLCKGGMRAARPLFCLRRSEYAPVQTVLHRRVFSCRTGRGLSESAFKEQKYIRKSVFPVDFCSDKV